MTREPPVKDTSGRADIGEAMYLIDPNLAADMLTVIFPVLDPEEVQRVAEVADKARVNSPMLASALDKLLENHAKRVAMSKRMAKVLKTK